VILGRHVGHAIKPIQEWMETNDGSFLEAEHAVLGYNHAEVGGRVALRWNLPTALVQAIAWHHEPVQNGQISPLATLVHVADVICLTAGLGLGADGLRVRVSSEALSALKLEQESMEAAMDCVLSRVAEAQPLFELHTLM
jgi:HD-like signal output (HDOD) protein